MTDKTLTETRKWIRLLRNSLTSESAFIAENAIENIVLSREDRIAELKARLKASKTFAWESTNRERLIQGGWTPPETLERDSGD